MHMHAATIIAGIIEGLAVLLIGFIARQVWKGVRSIGQDKAQREADHREVMRRLDGQDVKLDNIEHETHMNSGTSLKDATMRTEARVNDLAATLETHIRDAKYQQGKIDAYFQQHPTPVVTQVTTTPPA